MQAPFVPQDRVWPGVVCQHDVLIAVVVQVANGDAGAVGLEVIDRVAGHGGGVVEIVGVTKLSVHDLTGGARSTLVTSMGTGSGLSVAA